MKENLENENKTLLNPKYREIYNKIKVYSESIETEKKRRKKIKKMEKISTNRKNKQMGKVLFK